MKRQKLLRFVGWLLTPGLLCAQDWQLVDNFDDNNYEPWVIARANNICQLLPEYELGDEAYMLLVYPSGYEDNPAMHLESGGYGYADQYGTVYSCAPLPFEAPDGSTTTLYFQYYQEGSSNQFHFGLTSEELIPAAEPTDYQQYDSPTGWAGYSFLFRSNEDSSLEFRSGSSYIRHNSFSFENYTWYEIWLVAYNEVGTSIGAGGDRWEFWVKGGQYPDATQLMIPPSQPYDPFGNPNPDSEYAGFRNGTDQPLRLVEFSSQTGPPNAPNNGDPHIIDDLYYTMGKVIETPPNATERGVTIDLWNGWPVLLDEDELEYVETDAFLMDVYLVEKEGTRLDWVYSKILSWLYCDPDLTVSGTGGWVYSPELDADPDFILQFTSDGALDPWYYIDDMEKWVYVNTAEGWIYPSN